MQQVLPALTLLLAATQWRLFERLQSAGPPHQQVRRHQVCAQVRAQSQSGKATSLGVGEPRLVPLLLPSTPFPFPFLHTTHLPERGARSREVHFSIETSYFPSRVFRTTCLSTCDLGQSSTHCKQRRLRVRYTFTFTGTESEPVPRGAWASCDFRPLPLHLKRLTHQPNLGDPRDVRDLMLIVEPPLLAPSSHSIRLHFSPLPMPSMTRLVACAAWLPDCFVSSVPCYLPSLPSLVHVTLRTGRR